MEINESVSVPAQEENSSSTVLCKTRRVSLCFPEVYFARLLEAQNRLGFSTTTKLLNSWVDKALLEFEDKEIKGGGV